MQKHEDVSKQRNSLKNKTTGFLSRRHRRHQSFLTSFARFLYVFNVFLRFSMVKVIPESKAYQICPKKINPKMPCDTPWHQPKQYAPKKRGHSIQITHTAVLFACLIHPQTWMFFHDPCIPPPKPPSHFVEFHHLTSQSLVRAPLSWIGVFPKNQGYPSHKRGVWTCFLQVFFGIASPDQWRERSRLIL